MTEEQINICKDILERFIYNIRINEISQIIFTYYNKDYNILDIDVKDESHYNFEEVNQQIKAHILSQRNSFWRLNENKIKIVENLAINHPKEFETFKTFIERAWICDPAKQRERINKEENDKKREVSKQLKIILKDKYELYEEVIRLILEDTKIYPYKSDKIKVLLELELDVETIFFILQINDKWSSPRGYINKYLEERKLGILKKSIVIYELNSTIKHIIGQLKDKQ